MVIQIKHIGSGKNVVINNDGEIQGGVKVTGEEPFRSSIDEFLNKNIQIRHKDMLTSVLRILPTECIITNKSGVREIHKSSDLYLNEYFIPKFCSLHGYEVVTMNFNG